MVTVELLASFGLTQTSQDVLYDAIAFGTLLMALECAWRAPKAFLDEAKPQMWHHMGHPVLAGLVSVYLAAVWLFWTGGHTGISAILLLLVALPALIDLAQRSISHILRPPGAQEEGELQSVLGVILERAVRAVLITAAAVFLGHVSGIGLSALASQDTVLTRLVRALLDLVVIGLVADLSWQVARVLIDAKLRESTTSEHPSSSETSRQARLLTLLPILRNVLFMVIMVIAAMMALASLGVQIGPLVASAGVVGVAVGFGAQTLVRDILSGVFYLLDDAFRVGEYIQSGNYKGVVESFSLRSIKLRHQRGPIYTVPFGALGAVQNLSRDWTIEKMSVTVAYTTDLAKLKPLIKTIGKELLADPELAPHIIETLKLQGVENFTDSGIQIRMKMTTKPGEQFLVRRRAFVLIKQAFDANGIEFAVPTIQINSASQPPAATQNLELVRPARAAAPLG
jgi:small-conductance mechanosensitive channel